MGVEEGGVVGCVGVFGGGEVWGGEVVEGVFVDLGGRLAGVLLTVCGGGEYKRGMRGVRKGG